MGESACLMPSLSIASNSSLEAHQGSPIRCLEHSVSFGRFTSESLAWERWSSFNNNRYLEEVEKYSQPGSVAEKKAYFEAHYKRIAEKKAAALLEQAVSMDNNDLTSEINDGFCGGGNLDFEQHGSDNCLAFDKPREAKITPIDSDLSPNNRGYSTNKELGSEETNAVEEVPVLENPVHVDKSMHIESSKVSPFESDLSSTDKGYYLNEELDTKETNTVEEVLALENPVHVDNSMQIESSKLHEDVQDKMVTEVEISTTKHFQKLPLKESYSTNQESSDSSNKRKPVALSSKASVQSRATKLPCSPARPRTPAQSRKENKATPNNKKITQDAADKRRLTPKSIHMSLNFAPSPSPSRACETNKIATPILQKTRDSKVSVSVTKIPKDCPATPIRTLSKESANSVPKPLPGTPQMGNKRIKPPLEHATLGSRKGDMKCQSLSIDCSKSLSTASENRAWPSSMSSSFNFRSEERAAKRKEYFQKLEEKSNAREAQKMELQAKSKEKAETELRKLRQNLGFKAKPMPNFSRETPSSSNQIKKIPLTRPRSPKLGRKPNPSTAADSSTLPPRTPSVKSDVSKHGIDTSKRPPTRPGTSLPKKNAHDNASPNLQI